MATFSIVLSKIEYSVQSRQGKVKRQFQASCVMHISKEWITLPCLSVNFLDELQLRKLEAEPAYVDFSIPAYGISVRDFLNNLPPHIFFS